MSFKGIEAKWTAYTKEVKKSGDKSQISDAETVAGSVARVESCINAADKSCDDLTKKLTALLLSVNQLKKDAVGYRKDYGIPEAPPELKAIDDAVKDALKEAEQFKDAIKKGQKDTLE